MAQPIFSTPLRKKSAKISKTLPWVPKIIFPDGFDELEALTKSILESDEFEAAMNHAAAEFGMQFDEENMPEGITIVASKPLDKRHLFGLIDQTIDPDEETNYIHMSMELLENIVKQQGHNYELKFLACIAAVHEIAHFLLRTGLKMKNTPNKFKLDQFVSDFGCFVERALLKKLNLRMDGLLLFGSKEEFPTGWLQSTTRYSSLELGEISPQFTRLKKSYLKKIVDSKKLQAPTDDDIQELKKSGPKNIIHRGEPPFRGYRGKRGFQS
jgi:hypothetical protein